MRLPGHQKRIMAMAVVAGLLPLGAASAWGRVSMPDRLEEIRLVDELPTVAGVGRITLQVNEKGYDRLLAAGSARVEDFPLPDGRRVALDLAAFDLITDATRFLVAGAAGVRETHAPSMRFFRGQVAGETDSLASLNLVDGRIAGFVRIGKSEYTFAPRSFELSREGAFAIDVRGDAFESGPPGDCEGEEEVKEAFGGASIDPPFSPAVSIDATTLLIAPLAVEGTIEWVARHGGVAAAQSYTLNLLAQVSAVYEAEVNVQLQVPYLLMNATEPDGFTDGSTSTATLLSELRAKWNGTPGLRQVFRSATHLFGAYPSGGAGRAYVGVLCSNVPENTNSYDYGVSLLEGGGASWERRLVAHEIGHNFSSPHSHCYAPELDQCYNGESGCYAGAVTQTTGSMMSYCSTRLTTFHTRERDERVRPGAEAAYPRCLAVGGDPGDLIEENGDGLAVGAATLCAPASLIRDDTTLNGNYGYSGTAQAAWVKRFTPSCYPFEMTGLDVLISHSSVAPGRPIRLLVYLDPAASGSPAGAQLALAQDTTVQVISNTQWNRYTLSSPVLISSGDVYLGVHDLEADAANTYIMAYDSSGGGDSWWQANGTWPSDFNPFSAGVGTWMIRGAGGGVASGSLLLSWGAPCNDAAVPNQDYAVYQGLIGDWGNMASLTCTTGHQRAWFVQNAPADAFWIVVPQNSSHEGSYGRSSAGERFPAALACRPQAAPASACQ